MTKPNFEPENNSGGFLPWCFYLIEEETDSEVLGEDNLFAKCTVTIHLALNRFSTQLLHVGRHYKQFRTSCDEVF